MPHPHGCSVQRAGFPFFLDRAQPRACSPPPTTIPHRVTTVIPAGCSLPVASFLFLLFLLCCMPASPYLPPYLASLPPCLTHFFSFFFSLYLLLHPPLIYLHVHRHTLPLPFASLHPAAALPCMSCNWQAWLSFLSLSLSLFLSSLPQLM